MTTEIKSLHNYPLCDEVARANLTDLDERLSAVENGQESERTSYFDGGDLYDLLMPLEIESMKETDKRIQYTNPPRKQAYADHTIHYFDISTLKQNYDKLLVSCLVDGSWDGGICYYNPTTSAFTVATKPMQTRSEWLDLTAIPDGCYLATSCTDANYTTEKHKYFHKLWMNPNYVSKFEGLDESVTDKAVEMTISEEMMSADANYIYFVLDMDKYRDCMYRITISTSSSMRAWRTDSLTDKGTIILNAYPNDTFYAWTYPERYLVIRFAIRNYSNFANVNFTMGWINPEVARMQKQRKYFGPRLMGHNADTRTQLINACVWADIVDIDVCKTLDDKYVCIHDTSINGHVIAETNLEDLELTYNQMSADDAYSILKRYGTICFHNYRNATALEQADEDERAYNIVGDHAIWGENLTGNADHPLRGHLGKFWVTTTASAHSDTLVGFGAIPSKMIGSPSGDVTKYDINVVYSISTLTAWDLIPTDGSCAYVWINSDPANALNAPLTSE